MGACPPASLSLRISSSRGCVRCQPPPELGLSHSWLPIVHTRDRKHDTAGVWLYHARGCSDVEWDVGRTVLTRNRVHAAVELERRARGGSDQASIRRIAEWLRHFHPNWSAVARARHYFKSPGLSVEFVLAEAARGVFASSPSHRQRSASACLGPQFVRGALQPCACDERRPEWMWRILGLTRVAGDPVLELFAVQLIENLTVGEGYNGSRAFASVRHRARGNGARSWLPDTVQLEQQPQGNGPRELNWQTEIWDLRSVSRSAAACVDSMLDRHLRFRGSCGTPSATWLYAHASTELQPYLRLSNGTSCILSERFASCLSCRGSQLEEVCRDSA